MTISTVDGLIAAAAGAPVRFYCKNPLSAAQPSQNMAQSFWGFDGIPGRGDFDTTLNGVTLSSSSSLPNGALPFTDASGGQSTYLAKFSAEGVGTVGTTGLFVLCDRLWHNGGINITSTDAQSITSPTWPARDINGSTNGDGVYIGLEVSATVGAGTPTISFSYTNSAGTAGRTGGFTRTGVTSQIAGGFYMTALQGSDLGVRSVQSVTLSASWVSGTINLVAYRPIAVCTWPGTGVAYNPQFDPITGCMPTIPNGAVLWPIAWFGGNTQCGLVGSLTLVQG